MLTYLQEHFLINALKKNILYIFIKLVVLSLLNYIQQIFVAYISFSEGSFIETSVKFSD